MVITRNRLSQNGDVIRIQAKSSRRFHVGISARESSFGSRSAEISELRSAEGRSTGSRSLEESMRHDPWSIEEWDTGNFIWLEVEICGGAGSYKQDG